MNLNMSHLVSRTDVMNLALQYSIKNYKESDSNLIENLSNNEFTLNKLKENSKLINTLKDSDEDKNYLIIYAKCFISNKDLNLPSRGKPCIHSECLNFNELFEYVAIHK